MMSIEECVKIITEDVEDWKSAKSSYESELKQYPKDMKGCIARAEQRIKSLSLAIQILSRLNEESIVEILKYKDYPDKNYTLKDFKKVCPSQYREYVKQAQSLIQALQSTEEK